MMTIQACQAPKPSPYVGRSQAFSTFFFIARQVQFFIIVPEMYFFFIVVPDKYGYFFFLNTS